MSSSAATSIREVLALARQLEDQLDAEHSALLARDSEALLRVAGVKSGLVRALETSSRALAWNQLGLESQQELQARLGTCRNRNLANAALLDARRTQVQWALGFLGVANGNYYGANGATVTNFAARPVGIA